MRVKPILVAAAVALGTPAASASWTCENPPFFDPTVKKQMDRISGSFKDQTVIIQFLGRWDTQHMRRTCEAVAAGEDVEISCMNGRRDWAEIEAMYREGTNGLTFEETASLRDSLGMENATGLTAAIQYCRDLGAVE